MSLTPEQLEQRLNYICGSDAAVICGMSPYKNQIDLWQEKLGYIPEKDLSDNPYVKAGSFLEKAVLEWFEHETGLTVARSKHLHVSEDHPFMAGNLDGWIESEEAVFEAKTASSDKGWGESGTGEIPNHYLLQVVHYMAVRKAKKAYIAVLIRGVDFRYYVIEKNERLEERLISREKKFWEHVVSKTAPNPITSGEFISLNGFESLEEQAAATHEIQDYLDRLEQVKHSISILEGEKDELYEKLKVFMGKSDTLVDISGKIAATWKGGKPVKRFDANAFKTEKPEEYARYVKEFPQARRFLIK